MANDCLNLIKVLQDEYVYINDFYPQGISSWKFKKEHLVDPVKFVLRLQKVEQTEEPLTLRIFNELPLQAIAQLRQYNQVDMLPPKSLQNYIVDVLNNLLSDPGLRNTPNLPSAWKAEAWARAKIDLSGDPDFERIPELTSDLTLEITTEDVTLEITERTQPQMPREWTMSFNRRLLEIAFRDEIAEIQNTLAAVYDHIHAKQPAALCLSGGGVRSATFCLGIIQALAERGFLDKFNYLSTVSGGGYIGGWLSAWSHRHPQGLQGVINELKQTDSGASNSSTGTEPETVSRLRSTSNYLTPKLGVFSGDSWALIGTYLRNLFLNWLVLIPLIAAVVILPKLHVGFIQFLQLSASPDRSLSLSHAAAAVGLFLLAGAAVYIGFNRPSLGQSRRGDASYALLGLLPLVLGSMWLVGAFYGSRFSYPLHLWQFIAVGVGLKLIVWFVQLPAQLSSLRRTRRVPFRQDVEVLWESLAAIVSGALGGCLFWVVSTLFHSYFKDYPDLSYACFAGPLFLLLALITEGFFIGLVSIWTSDEDREWWARAGGWVLLTAVGWAALNLIVLYGPYLFPPWLSAPDRLSYFSPGPEWVETLKSLFFTIGGPVSGILTILIGKSPLTPAHKDSETPATKERGTIERLKPLLSQWTLKLVMPVFIVFFVALISIGADWITYLAWSTNGSWISTSLPFVSKLHTYDHFFWYPWPVLLVLLFGFVLTGLLMARFIDANKFSLNSGYRNRLIRAYLGASRNYRIPNPFTGFDQEDNLHLYELAGPNRFGFFNKNLFHVLNLTLNLVAGKNLAWQERKAESFTMSPLHCGNHNLGYRSSTEYGRVSDSSSALPTATRPADEVPERELPISLGFAMSLSGAVASPNMGYYSSKSLSFLLTLFNVRLGGWLTNPAKCGDRARGKLHSYFALLYELFGLTDDKSPYVYLSDGGHFENLGLYEMVLRRCHNIVVVDAGEDPKCACPDLGKAIHKIRTDLGVPIEFSAIDIYSRDDKAPHEKRAYCAMGRIHYSHVDETEKDGRLLYIKPAFYEAGDEPRDVYEYAERCADFPHDSTADQWFGESQFESYRALGYYIFKTIAKNVEKDASMECLFDDVEQGLKHKDQGGYDEIRNLLGMIPWQTGQAAGSFAGVR